MVGGGRRRTACRIRRGDNIRGILLTDKRGSRTRVRRGDLDGHGRACGARKAFRERRQIVLRIQRRQAASAENKEKKGQE